MRKKYWVFFIMLISVVVLSGCAMTPRKVTLPERLKSLYIPMCRNISYQPGIEEYATNYIIEEFVADGRLNVVEKKYADALLEVTLKNYTTPVSVANSDDFPIQKRALVLADVALWEPNETKPTILLKDVTASAQYIVDPKLETLFRGDAKDELMKNFARIVVDSVFYGEYPQQKYLTESFTPIITDDEYLDRNPFDFR